MNHEKNNEKVLKKLRDIDDIVAHNQQLVRTLEGLILKAITKTRFRLISNKVSQIQMLENADHANEIEVPRSPVKRIFRFREAPHLLVNVKRKLDFQFPETDKISYENYIGGIIHHELFYRGINIVMRDGSKSELPYNAQDKNSFTISRINQEQTPIRQVIMKGDGATSEFGGCQFIGESG